VRLGWSLRGANPEDHVPLPCINMSHVGRCFVTPNTRETCSRVYVYG